MAELVFRETQEYAIAETVKAFREGRDTVVLHAPTGSGKTIIAAEVVRQLGWRAFYTSPQRSLVQQASTDPRFAYLQPDHQTLMGKSNYECYRDLKARHHPALDASEAVCFQLDRNNDIQKDAEGRQIPCVHKKWWDRDVLPDCAYYAQKARAEMAPLAVTTLAYYFTGVAFESKRLKDEQGDPLPEPGSWLPSVGWWHGRMSSRPLLIVDEAHGLESEVVRYLSSRWSELKYRSNAAYDGAWQRWTESPEAVAILDQPEATDEQKGAAVAKLIETVGGLRTFQEDVSDVRQVKFLEQLGRDMDGLQTVVSDLVEGVPWVIRYRMEDSRRAGRKIPVLELQPVVAAPHLQRRLWAKAPKVLLMSGTFFTSRETLVDVGLLDRPAREVRVRSEFPPENGPVYRVPVARLKYENMAVEFPKVVAAVGRLLDIEKGRGVIHAQSFQNVERIREGVPERHRSRMWWHRTSDGFDRDEFIREFKETSEPGAVLVSPSVTEGLDLPGDLGEWTAFVKCPYPSRGDERIRRRMELVDGRTWYEKQTLLRAIQGRGRVLRSADDRGTCWVLDQALGDLIYRWRHAIPEWFMDAVSVGDRTLDPAVRNHVLGVDPEGRPLGEATA